MKQYPKYKDSEIQWIGEIPGHWEMKYLKFWVMLKNEKVNSTSQFDFKVALENIEKETGKIVLGNGSFEGVGNAFKSGDVLFNKLRPYLAKVWEADKDGIAVGELLVLEPRFCIGSFLKYRLLSKDFIDIVDSSTYGAKMPRANWNFIGNINLPYPPLSEQTAIASFLDHKTSEIDQLIAAKEDLITKLEAQRKAIINEAVTGQAYKTGLIPTPDGKEVRFKDSGIEWLGEIPEHWGFIPLKHISYMKGRIGWQGLKSDEFIEEGPFLITGMNFKNGKIRWEEVYHITEERYNEAPEIQLKGGDVLMTKDGTIGKLLFIDDIPFPGKASLNSHLLVLRPINEKYYAKYLYYLLDSFIFKRHIELTKTGTTFFGITQESVGNFFTLLPEVSQQIAIVNFLDAKLEIFDVTIIALTESIRKLRQFKQSLISEAVTGKIDVRDWQKE